MNAEDGEVAYCEVEGFLVLVFDVDSLRVRNALVYAARS